MPSHRSFSGTQERITSPPLVFSVIEIAHDENGLDKLDRGLVIILWTLFVDKLMEMGGFFLRLCNKNGIRWWYRSNIHINTTVHSPHDYCKSCRLKNEQCLSAINAIRKCSDAR